MADAVSDTGAGRVKGGLGLVVGDAVIAFNKSNVMLPLVTAKQAVKGAITVQFVDYTKIGFDEVSRPVYGKFPEKTKKVNVDIKKLDNFNFKKIDFIKIDVQGYEFDVLKGAETTLTVNNPIICLEEDNPNNSKTIPYLKSLGYSIIDIINKEHIFKKSKILK